MNRVNRERGEKLICFLFPQRMLDYVDLMDALIMPSACVMRIKADIPVSALIATLQSIPAMFVVRILYTTWRVEVRKTKRFLS